MLEKKFHDYEDNGTLLKGYYAYDADASSPMPAVLIAHDWTGRNEFACKKAERLAELGYLGFAIDMYGDGKQGSTREEKSQLIAPFLENRHRLQQRIIAAVHSLSALPQADTTRIAAIGFCFGGMCVLDLARSNIPNVLGVVSFHGLLQAPDASNHQTISAKILALHGYDDPMVTPDVVNAFANEMTHAKADWQLHIYGHTQHAFTNPDANDPAFGTVYNKNADLRSFEAMKNFLRETLA